VKYTFGTLSLTDQAIEAASSSSDKKAIAAILATEITALKDDFRKDINRQWFNDGTGQLCLANGTGTSSYTTIITDSPGTRYIHAGMYVKIGTGVVVEVSAVNSSTQFTVATAIPHNDNDVITKENVDEMMGFKGLIDTGTYVENIQAISRTTNAWASCQSNAAAFTNTEAQMITVYMQCLEYGKPSVIFAGPLGFADYGNLLVTYKKTYNLTEVLSGGWKGLEFMGGDCGVVLDYDCPEMSSQNYNMYMVDFDTFTIAEMTEPFKWLEAEANGGILRRSPTVRTNWEGTLKYYANLVCKNFRANGRMLYAQSG
jgi:hypothetical protein